MTATVQTLATPDGPFTLLADDDGAVLASGWTGDVAAIVARLQPRRRPADIRAVADDAPATDAAAAVAAYYAGDLTAIDAVPVRQHGTDLQRAGWAQLRRIRPGGPLSYAGFAAELGAPSAVRAAAAICARNAPALFVPCHRVLRTDGTLGGFAWGVAVKQSLLTRESA
ncbi:methylated-DNA--[protein]-cysteine S-methyltransferase [Microbacterium sp. NPDC091313]